MLAAQSMLGGHAAVGQLAWLGGWGNVLSALTSQCLVGLCRESILSFARVLNQTSCMSSQVKCVCSRVVITWLSSVLPRYTALPTTTCVALLCVQLRGMMAALMALDTRGLDLGGHLQALMVAYNATKQAPRYCGLHAA